MKREQYLQELCESTIFGGLITVIIFAFSHQIFTSPGEVIAFWCGTWLVASYMVWSVIVWKQKRRDAWQSNHGKKSE